MRRTPRTAIVMPARDAAAWVTEAIDSALAQTDADLDVVVVDDGSTDRTPEFVEAAARRDSRVRLLHAEGRGPGAARNQGVRATAAPFLCFLDADDLLAPDALETRHATLAAHLDAALAYGDTRLVRATDGADVRIDRPLRDGDRMAASLRRGDACFYPHAALLRRSWFERVGGFPESMDEHEDLVLWTQLALAGGAFVHCDAPPNVYRMRPDSRSHAPLFATSGRILLLRRLLASDLSPDERRTVTARLRERLLLLAGVRAADGDLAGARRDALRSLRLARRPGHVRESLACALSPRRAEGFLAHLPEHMDSGHRGQPRSGSSVAS